VGEVSIEVSLREGRGKAANRKLRAAGQMPAVVYGHGHDPVALSLDPKLLEKKIRDSHAGMNTLFDLVGERAVAGRTVLIKELQREPVRGFPIHADFYEIDVNVTLEVSVPIHLEGTPQGVVMGGVLEHVLRELELSCLPSAIPDEIVVDVSGMDIGDSLHVSDLPLPKGVELVTDDSLSVVSVMAPRVEEEEVTEEAEEAAAEGEEPGEESGEESAEAEEDGDTD